MKVKLISKSEPTPEMKMDGVRTLGDQIAYCARVSNPSNQLNTQTADKLLAYLIKHKHWSPFEMVSMCLEIETTRDIGRQILRHRSFSFQEFCVAEGTLITTLTKGGRSKRVPIEDLYKRYISPQYSAMSDWLVRVYDEETKELVPAKVKEVFKTGIKDCYKLKLHNGRTIECTKEHKFFTREGFDTLENIQEGQAIAINGAPVYQNKEWLEKAKIECIKNKTGVQGIANKAGCSYHTIRKWLRKHELQFSKKEVASYTTAWNKGLPSEQQPNYGKPHSKETREKLSASARKGEESNLYKNGKYSIEGGLPWRQRIAQICKGEHLTLLVNQEYKCKECETTISKTTSEVDHKLPVHLYPEEALNIKNLRALCKKCHADKSAIEGMAPLESIKWAIVESIEYVGKKETYDIEVEHSSHNYIANGIVTHNSQRYAEVDFDVIIRDARLQDKKNRQNSIETDDEKLQGEWINIQTEVAAKAMNAYEWALKKGIAKEQARVVLPEGLTGSRLYMNGTIRSWMHYAELRGGHGTQKEHIEIALEVQRILKGEGIDF